MINPPGGTHQEEPTRRNPPGGTHREAPGLQDLRLSQLGQSIKVFITIRIIRPY